MTQADEDFALPSQVKRTDTRRGNAGPRSSDVPGIGKDQYGRYVINDEPYSRVTTIAGVGINQDGLRVWTERKIIDGLRLAPALRSRIAVSDVADDKTADEVLKEAKIRGGVHDAAAEGTARHDEIERWVRTQDDYAPPPELEADVTAAIAKFLESRLSLLKVEQLGVIDFLRCAGRLDALAIAPNGKARILDWKFGADVLSSSGKRAQYARQLSGYANFTHFVVVGADGTLTLQPADEVADIDRETAYLMHTTGGVAHLYEVPIAAAWREFQASAILHKGNSADGAPIFHEIGRPWRFEPKRDEPAPIDVDTSWLPPSTDDQYEITKGLRCPSCNAMAATVDKAGNFDCEACHVFGAAYDELTSGNDVAAAPSITPEVHVLRTWSPTDVALGPDRYEQLGIDRTMQAVCCHCDWLERSSDPEKLDMLAERHRTATGHNTVREGADEPMPARLAPVPGESEQQDESPSDPPGGMVDGTGEPLQPLGKDVGKRGCGVCGRIGHKRGSAKCLGDSDPAFGAGPSVLNEDPGGPPVPEGTNATTIGDRQNGNRSYVEDGKIVTVPDETHCDGKCQQPVPPGLEPERRDGRVTGRYVCAGCGLPATVTAVRAHVAAVGSGARSLDEQQAAAARLRGHEPIPDPPAQLPQQDKPHDWLGYFQDAQNTQVLAACVDEMRDAGQATEELFAAASERWRQLADAGA